MKQNRLEELTTQITKLTGQSADEVLINSLEEKLVREKEKQSTVEVSLKDKLLEIAREYRDLPTQSYKSDAEILEY